MRFSAKTALITGAASGIGLKVAGLLAQEGAARLHLVDRDSVALAAVEFECDVVRHVGDVADEAFWASVALDRIDHAVINAGVAGAASIVDLAFAEWRNIVSANLDGAFLSMQAALRAIDDGGSVVAVSSAAGIKAEPGVAAYAASKAGLIQLARVAAKEGAGRGIRVNAIAPGGVQTPIWEKVPMFADRVREIGRDAAFSEMASMATPLGRFASAEEIAEQIAFLLSDHSATITGAVLVSDGGYTL